MLVKFLRNVSSVNPRYVAEEGQTREIGDDQAAELLSRGIVEKVEVEPVKVDEDDDGDETEEVEVNNDDDKEDKPKPKPKPKRNKGRGPGRPKKN